MANPIDPGFVYALLWHIDRGHITAKPGSGADGVLQNLRHALSDIQDGVNPDEALRITRHRGNTRDPWKVQLVWLIHCHKERDEKWQVITHLAGDWLESIGRKPLAQSTLKNLYAEMRDEVVSLARFVEMVNAEGRITPQ